MKEYHFDGIYINKILNLLTVVMFIFMYIGGIAVFGSQGFGRPQVFLNLFINNTGLIVISAAMTMVIISGGIDISVGSMVAMDCMILGDLMMNKGWNAWLAMLAVIIVGIVYGTVQGLLISYMELQPFAVTLTGMFFCRGMAAVISSEVISISNKTFEKMSECKIYIPALGTVNKHGKMIYPFIYPSVIVALLIILIIYLMLKYTRFGRGIYAIGGNENAALILGLDVKKIKLFTYIADDLLVSVGGILFCMNSMSCFSDQAKGLEIDAIAGTVIGGTLLSGGVGNVAATLVGCLIRAIAETFISFDGSLSSWWIKIVTAALLSFFIILQSALKSIMLRK
mgnify:CR=1 FL=1